MYGTINSIITLLFSEVGISPRYTWNYEKLPALLSCPYVVLGHGSTIGETGCGGRPKLNIESVADSRGIQGAIAPAPFRCKKKSFS